MTQATDLVFERKKRANRAAEFSKKEVLLRALEDIEKGEFDSGQHAFVIVWKTDESGLQMPTFYTNIPSAYQELGMVQAALQQKTAEMWEKE